MKSDDTLAHLREALHHVMRAFVKEDSDSVSRKLASILFKLSDIIEETEQ